jgi:two-component system sensor histidine kinase VanS
MDRAPGLSVRLKLTLSYAGFLMLAGILMLAAVWVVVLRYIPNGSLYHMHPSWSFVVNRSDPLHGFGSIAAIVLAFLLVFGLVGGWILAGRMLAPLTRITDATRMAATGSLSHRIQLPGRDDEFRELADTFDTMLARLEAHIAEQQRFAANA